MTLASVRRTCSVSTSGSLVCSAGVGERLENRRQVAHRDAFAKQTLKHPMDHAEAELRPTRLRRGPDASP